eukprot:1160475-Pelagomonas_calceolata.AAC.6
MPDPAYGEQHNWDSHAPLLACQSGDPHACCLSAAHTQGSHTPHLASGFWSQHALARSLKPLGTKAGQVGRLSSFTTKWPNSAGGTSQKGEPPDHTKLTGGSHPTHFLEPCSKYPYLRKPLRRDSARVGGALAPAD